MTRDSIVCGIISYMPNDMKIKIERINRLNRLFKQIDILLNIPIMIIAQNWKGIQVREGTTRKPIIIYNYENGLGINGAREVLREKFLDSDFEYLVMLDDDSQLSGTIEGGNAYLADIERHPGGYGVFKPSLLKLFAISKEMFHKVVYPPGGADDENPQMRFFEDMYLVNSLKLNYPEKGFQFKLSGIMENSDSAYDEFSTGWHDVYQETSEYKWDRHDTGNLTRGMIIDSTKESLKDPSKLYRGDAVLLEDYNKFVARVNQGRK